MNSKNCTFKYKDNTNFWGHIMMLFNLYWPGMKRDIISYALIPFLTYILAIVLQKYTDKSLSWFFEAPLAALLVASPMMLAKKDYREICAQLPVSRLEKFCFLILTFYIAIPVIMWVSLELGQLICSILFDAIIPIHFFNIAQTCKMLIGLPPYFFGPLLVMICFISVILYWVIKTKGDRGAAVVISFFLLTYFLMFIAMGFEMLGYHIQDIGMSEKAFTNLTSIFYTVLYGGISTIFLIKLYRLLGKSGF